MKDIVRANKIMQKILNTMKFHWYHRYHVKKELWLFLFDSNCMCTLTSVFFYCKNFIMKKAVLRWQQQSWMDELLSSVGCSVEALIFYQSQFSKFEIKNCQKSEIYNMSVNATFFTQTKFCHNLPCNFTIEISAEAYLLYSRLI